MNQDVDLRSLIKTLHSVPLSRHCCGCGPQKKSATGLAGRPIIRCDIQPLFEYLLLKKYVLTLKVRSLSHPCDHAWTGFFYISAERERAVPCCRDCWSSVKVQKSSEVMEVLDHDPDPSDPGDPRQGSDEHWSP